MVLLTKLRDKILPENERVKSILRVFEAQKNKESEERLALQASQHRKDKESLIAMYEDKLSRAKEASDSILADTKREMKMVIDSLDRRNKELCAYLTEHQGTYAEYRVLLSGFGLRVDRQNDFMERAVKTIGNLYSEAAKLAAQVKDDLRKEETAEKSVQKLLVG